MPKATIHVPKNFQYPKVYRLVLKYGAELLRAPRMTIAQYFAKKNMVFTCYLGDQERYMRRYGKWSIHDFMLYFLSYQDIEVSNAYVVFQAMQRKTSNHFPWLHDLYQDAVDNFDVYLDELPRPGQKKRKKKAKMKR